MANPRSSTESQAADGSSTDDDNDITQDTLYTPQNSTLDNEPSRPSRRSISPAHDHRPPKPTALFSSDGLLSRPPSSGHQGSVSFHFSKAPAVKMDLQGNRKGLAASSSTTLTETPRQEGHQPQNVPFSSQGALTQVSPFPHSTTTAQILQPREQRPSPTNNAVRRASEEPSPTRAMNQPGDPAILDRQQAGQGTGSSPAGTRSPLQDALQVQQNPPIGQLGRIEPMHPSPSDSVLRPLSKVTEGRLSTPVASVENPDELTLEPDDVFLQSRASAAQQDDDNNQEGSRDASNNVHHQRRRRASQHSQASWPSSSPDKRHAKHRSSPARLPRKTNADRVRKKYRIAGPRLDQAKRVRDQQLRGLHAETAAAWQDWHDGEMQLQNKQFNEAAKKLQETLLYREETCSLLEGENASVLEALTGERAKLKELNAEFTALKTRMTTLQANATTMKTDKASFQRRCEEATDANTKLSKRYQSLAHNLTVAKAKIRSVTEELASIKDEEKQAKTERDAALVMQELLEKQLEQKAGELTEERNNKFRVQEQSERSMQTFERLEGVVRALGSGIEGKISEYRDSSRAMQSHEEGSQAEMLRVLEDIRLGLQARDEQQALQPDAVPGKFADLISNIEEIKTLAQRALNSAAETEPELRNQINTLTARFLSEKEAREQIASLQASCASLKDAMTAVDEKRQTAEASSTHLQQSLTELSARHEETKLRLSKEQDLISRLQDESQQTQQYKQQSGLLQTTNAELERQQSDLSRNLDTAKNNSIKAQEDLVAARNALEQAKCSSSALEVEKARIEGRHQAELEAKERQMQESLSHAMATEASKLQAQKDSHNLELSRTHQELSVSQRENSERSDHVRRLEDDLSGVTQARSQLEMSIQDLREQLQGHQSEHERRANELDQQKSQCDWYRTKFERLGHVEQQCELLAAQCADLQSQVDLSQQRAEDVPEGHPDLAPPNPANRIVRKLVRRTTDGNRIETHERGTSAGIGQIGDAAFRNSDSQGELRRLNSAQESVLNVPETPIRRIEASIFHPLQHANSPMLDPGEPQASQDSPLKDVLQTHGAASLFNNNESDPPSSTGAGYAAPNQYGANTKSKRSLPRVQADDPPVLFGHTDGDLSDHDQDRPPFVLAPTPEVPRFAPRNDREAPAAMFDGDELGTEYIGARNTFQSPQRPINEASRNDIITPRKQHDAFPGVHHPKPKRKRPMQLLDTSPGSLSQETSHAGPSSTYKPTSSTPAKKSKKSRQQTITSPATTRKRSTKGSLLSGLSREPSTTRRSTKKKGGDPSYNDMFRGE